MDLVIQLDPAECLLCARHTVPISNPDVPSDISLPITCHRSPGLQTPLLTESLGEPETFPILLDVSTSLFA